MPDRITKTQRWLDLIAFLLGRRLPVLVEEIMQAVPAYAAGLDGGETAEASARRMFERDKDELRKLGIPLDTTTYSVDGLEQQGYRLARRDFYLPYLRILSGAEAGGARASGGGAEVTLNAEEAGLAFDAVRRVGDLPAFPYVAEARSAFRKLAFDLDPERLASPAVLHVDPPGTGEQLARLRVISDALLARRRVHFAYHGIHRGETTQRDVAPYGIFFHRDWYLVGHDAVRDALRVFRVARMEEVRSGGGGSKRREYEIPEEFRLEGYLRREAWELGGGEEAPVLAEVRFAFPASVLAARNEVGEAVEERPDGSSVRRFEVQQVDPFLRWILTQEGEAEILGPPELREAMREMRGRVAALYEGGTANG